MNPMLLSFPDLNKEFSITTDSNSRIKWNLTNSTFRKIMNSIVRGQSDKYLASPPDGVTIAREIFYRIVHSRRRLLSKFQPRSRSFVLTACGIGRFR